MVKLIVPAGVDTVAFGGTVYRVADGMAEVPEEAAVHLYQYGFAPAPEKPKRRPKAAAAETETEAGDA